MGKSIRKVGSHLQHELMGRKLIAYYVEWCDTPFKRARGVTYNDTIVLYDDPAGTILRHVKKRDPNLNVYLGVPHNLLRGMDPALEQAM